MPRGGKRPGAGRPPKRDWLAEIEIGQACEMLWREARNDAMNEHLSNLFVNDSELQTLWAKVQSIPGSERAAWVGSEKHVTHHADIEEELNDLAGTPDATDPAPRCVTISTKPPKGTRQRIIAEIASRYGISTDTANRLWKAYRRFERELCEPD